MSTNAASSKPSFGKLKPNTVSPKTQYLVLYNLLSLVLWLGILLRLVATFLLTRTKSDHTLIDPKSVVPDTPARSSLLDTTYAATFEPVKWTQTLALVEIAHAASGLVRTSVMTTTMQVASRLLLVWGVVYLFGQGLLIEGSSGLVRKGLDWGFGSIPGLEAAAGIIAKASNTITDLGPRSSFSELERNQAAYAGMLFAWSVTECIRYLYFVFFIGSKTGNVPGVLGWLRYNTFFVLYPIGISCECWLVYHAIPFAKLMDERYAWFLIATLAIYVPGSYILYSHMMVQRRKVMKGKGKAKAKAT